MTDADGVAEADLAWCYDAIEDVSRTFAITVAELEEPLAREICLGYLLCRVADTVEDSRAVPPEEKATLLGTYRRALDPAESTTVADFRAAVDPHLPADPGPDWTVVAEAERVVDTFRGLPAATRECVRPPAVELVGGMAEFVDRYADAGGLRLETLAELEEYCWYAAGTVGELVTGLVSREADPGVCERLTANSRAFGLLLQLVNVAKDVRVDYRQENNVYLPAAWLAEADLDPSDLGDPAAADRVAPLVARLADHAAGYLDGAQAWLEAVPEDRGNRLAAWGVPFLLAVGTLRELRTRPGDAVREGDVKVSRAEVAAVVDAFDGDPDLGRLRERVARRPLQEW